MLGIIAQPRIEAILSLVLTFGLRMQLEIQMDQSSAEKLSCFESSHTHSTLDLGSSPTSVKRSCPVVQLGQSRSQGIGK